MNNEIFKYSSPNKIHNIEFIFAGEIAFGPQYFNIKIDNQLVSGRIFGLSLIWHTDSTFVAIQEWLAIDKILGPKTALTLFDLKNKQYSKISISDNGFIKPILFDNGKIIFQKDYTVNQAKLIEFEILVNDIKNWEAVNYA